MCEQRGLGTGVTQPPSALTDTRALALLVSSHPNAAAKDDQPWSPPFLWVRDLRGAWPVAPAGVPWPLQAAHLCTGVLGGAGGSSQLWVGVKSERT